MTSTLGFALLGLLARGSLSGYDIAAQLSHGVGPFWYARHSQIYPELARLEAANILRRLERAGEIATAEANAAFEDLMDLDFESIGFDAFAERAWQLRRRGRYV